MGVGETGGRGGGGGGREREKEMDEVFAISVRRFPPVDAEMAQETCRSPVPGPQGRAARTARLRLSGPHVPLSGRPAQPAQHCGITGISACVAPVERKTSLISPPLLLFIGRQFLFCLFLGVFFGVG